MYIFMCEYGLYVRNIHVCTNLFISIEPDINIKTNNFELFTD